MSNDIKIPRMADVLAGKNANIDVNISSNFSNDSFDLLKNNSNNKKDFEILNNSKKNSTKTSRPGFFSRLLNRNKNEVTRTDTIQTPTGTININSTVPSNISSTVSSNPSNNKTNENKILSITELNDFAKNINKDGKEEKNFFKKHPFIFGAISCGLAASLIMIPIFVPLTSVSSTTTTTNTPTENRPNQDGTPPIGGKGQAPGIQ